MKYIQSLFIRDDQNPFVDSFGWVAPYYHLMGWALSCLTLKNQLGHLSLYCNRRAKELLIDVLELPYDEVHESMNNWNPPHPQLWALSKIHTYAQQKEPFLHIDGDVFLFDKFPERITKASVVAQNVEAFTDYYYTFMKPIKRRFIYHPVCLKDDFKKMENLHALNAGILGGCDIDFFQRYTAEAFKYVEANLENLSEMDANRFNVFFEQHLCYKMAEEKKIRVEYLLPQTYHDNSYLGLDQFHEIESGNIKYLHLLGNYKADEFTCQQMAKTLNSLYPEFYHRILNLCSVVKKMNVQLDQLDLESLKHEINNTTIDSFQSPRRYFMWEKPSITKDFDYDYKTYKNNINELLIDFSKIKKQYLIERDKQAFHWFNQIFYQGYNFVTSPYIHVLSSNIDWARLYRSERSSGIKYYADYTIDDIKGGYFSVLIPELNDKGFSLFDIDSIESQILNYCYKPTNIAKLKDSLLMHYNISNNNKILLKFSKLLHENLKRLILIKALQPVTE